MDKHQTRQERSPSLIATSVVAGVTSGVVTAALLALGLLRGDVASQPTILQPLAADEPQPSIEIKALLEVIVELTSALDRSALSRPEPSRTALNRPKPAEDLKQTLQSLNETLERLASSPQREGPRPAAVIDEVLRVQDVCSNEIQGFAAAAEEADQEDLSRTLFLRSIEYMVNRFGVPSELSPGQGLIRASWFTNSASLNATFVDGYVVSVSASVD